MSEGKNEIPCIQEKFESFYEALKIIGYSQEYFTDNSSFTVHISNDGNFKKIDETFYIPLTEKDKRELIYHATAIYLAAWLGQDKNAKQTINSFAARGFCAVDEKIYKAGGAGSDPTLRSHFKRAEEKYRILSSLYQQQAQAENRGYKPDTSWRVEKKKLKIAPSQENSTQISPNGGIWYDFQDLCLIEWIADYKFSLYDLLVYTKKFMTKSNAPRNEAIRDAYKDYFDAINELKKCPDDRTYTISAIMIQQIEASFGHMAAAYFSRILEFNTEVTTSNIMHDTLVWWIRCPHKAFIHNTRHQSVNMPYNILGYREAVASIRSSDQEYFYAVRKQLLKRAMLTDMLLIVNHVFSPKERPSWCDDDYRYAAEFFKKDYPIIEFHTSGDLRNPKEWSDKECDFIREFYEYVSPNGLGDLRHVAQKMNKARNFRGTKQPT